MNSIEELGDGFVLESHEHNWQKYAGVYICTHVHGDGVKCQATTTGQSWPTSGPYVYHKASNDKEGNE